MVSLRGKTISLRALEKRDLDFLYRLENDTDVWEVSGTITPYSKGVLKLYLENAHRDIYEVKQLRLAISNKNQEAIGLIDLYDFDPKNKRAGLGVIVADKKDRNKGVGAEAIALLSNYAFTTLGLHQIYANILQDNKSSIGLFEKLGFEKIGVKKDWIFSNNSFKNELLFQKLTEDVS